MAMSSVRTSYGLWLQETYKLFLTDDRGTVRRSPARRGPGGPLEGPPRAANGAQRGARNDRRPLDIPPVPQPPAIEAVSATWGSIIY